MAKVSGPNQFTGKLGDLTYYKLPGSDQIYVKYSSGPSRERVKSSPEFANTQKHNSEFGGGSRAASLLQKCLGEIRYLKDYNYFGDLNKFIVSIRKVDDTSHFGTRSILFSKKGNILDGFNFNKSKPFDAIVRHPILFDISRENSKAIIQLPELTPNYNFFPSKDQSLYEIRISFAFLPDVICTSNGYMPVVDCDKLQVEATSGWHPVIETQKAKNLELTLPPIPDQSCSLILSIGIRYGARFDNGFVLPVPKRGSGKILAIR